MKKTILTMALLFASIAKMHGSASENRISTISPDAFRGLNELNGIRGLSGLNRISPDTFRGLNRIPAFRQLPVPQPRRDATGIVSSAAAASSLPVDDKNITYQ